MGTAKLVPASSSGSPLVIPPQACGDGPLVWGLLEGRAGDDQQIERLIGALGWRYELKRPMYDLVEVFRHRLGVGDVRLADELGCFGPPWPDVVITVGGRSVAAARYIRLRSEGRTRLVAVGRPWAPLDWFDLVITTPQYRLPKRRNVLQNCLPLNAAPEVQRTPEAAAWTQRLSALPAPRVAVLVGGNNGTYRFDTRAARALAGRLDDEAGSIGGSLLICTSPRTGLKPAEALLSAVASPHLGYVWGRDPIAANPYPLFLSVAQRIVVTGDSASMLADACRTSADVFVYDLPRTLRTKTLDWIQARLGSTHETRWKDALVSRGLWIPRRDLTRIHRQLRARGRIAELGSPPSKAGDVRELDLSVRRVRELVEHPVEAPRIVGGVQ